MRKFGPNGRVGTIGSKRVRVAIFALAFWVILAEDSHGYIDPGQGSYLFQLMIAGALGLVFTFKGYWATIKDFFRRFFSADKK